LGEQDLFYVHVPGDFNSLIDNIDQYEDHRIQKEFYSDLLKCKDGEECAIRDRRFKGVAKKTGCFSKTEQPRIEDLMNEHANK
jgi:hypothetical protein